MTQGLLEKASVENIRHWLERINTYNSTPEFGTTRILFTKPEVEARRYVKAEMEKLGLQVREDAIGNIFGVLEGEEPDLPPVWTGSHIDTVLNAGMFDGMSGVVAGLEAVRLLKTSGARLTRNIVVVVYTSEEPTRFELGCLGSRAMAGKLPLKEAEKLKDKDGKSLPEVLTELGYDLTEFGDIPVNKGAVYGAVELHVDQTGVLERAGKTIGIVKTICAPTNYDIEVTGCQSHAGGTSMMDRKDAYAASCEIGLALEELARQSSSEYTTATVGRVEVIPNAVNVIPGKVIFSIDIRDCDFESKQDLIRKLEQKIAVTQQERNVQVKMTQYNNDYPMICDSGIIAKIEAACRRRRISCQKVISGAFHDSMLVGEFAPVAMIFVPSKNGISHSPEEWTDFEDIAAGTEVLADTLFHMANEIETVEGKSYPPSCKRMDSAALVTGM